ncbi:terpene synthase family protein [Nocardia brasiliensis]|uniref:terpene synthase family protein n=1 Tax=Nocardia brasiliensis TaxID=37326 RepID=UPI00245613EB|nr:terpene synthase family protein [Nocardia brasiliensis]
MTHSSFDESKPVADRTPPEHTVVHTVEGDFLFPRFEVPFPLKHNPHVGAAAETMWRWVDASGIISTAEERIRIARTRVDYSGSYAALSASQPTLELLLKLLAVSFRVDDLMDEADRGSERCRIRERFISRLFSVLDGKPPSADWPLGRALAECWQEIEARGQGDWLEFMRNDYCSFLETYAHEARMDAEHRLPTLEEFFARRIHSVGTMWLWDINDLDLPFLPPHVRTNPHYRNLRQSSSLHIALVNDVYSLQREMVLGYPYNTVRLLVSKDGCTVQQAVDHVVQLCEDLVSKVMEEWTMLMADIDDDDLTEFGKRAIETSVESVMLSMRGQLEWHRMVQRYEIGDLRSRTCRNWAESASDLG